MSEPVQAAAAELAVLFPRLAQALTRDNTAEKGRAVTASVPYNPDVMHAIVVVEGEVPRACQRACGLIREPWKEHPLDRCFLALPRLHGRMHDLSLADACRELEQACYHWLRVTKRALNLRKPDMRIHRPDGSDAVCPACEEGELYAIGEENFMRETPDGWKMERLNREAFIYCTCCPETWPMAEWEWLGNVLESAVA